MSDKDDKKQELERQRERDMDAEIFGKTMGFVYQKDSEDFQKTVVLKHPHAPGLNREAEAAKPTPPQPAKPAAPQAAKPTPPQPAKPAAPQAAKPTPPQPAKPAAPQAAKPTPPQPAKPAAPQAAKPTPPQPAKPAAPQAAKPTPPQPARPAAPAPSAAPKTPEAEVFDLGTDLSLEELDEFLLPAELEETGAPVTTKPAEPEPAAEGLDLLDFSELDVSLLEEVETGTAEPSKTPVSEDEALLAALDELASETAELEKGEQPSATAKPRKAAGAELPDLDLETGDFTSTQGSEFLVGEPATAASATGKVLLTEADELPKAAAELEENEFLMVEEPAPAVTEKSLSKEPPFQEQYDEEEEIETIGAAVPEASSAIQAAERDFITTKPDDLTEAPAFQPVPQAVPTVSQPAAKPRGSGFAVFLALLGIAAAGGVGWLTMQSMDRIDQLEARIAALSGRAQPNAVNVRQDQAIDSLKAQTADLEQQLGALTGVVSDLTTNNNKRKTRPAPKPTKPKPAPKPAPAQSAAPATTSTTAATATTDDWVINLTSVASESAALDEIQRLKGQGINAESVRVDIDGKPWYRIRVGNFPTEAAANARKNELAQRLGIRDAWVSHR